LRSFFLQQEQEKEIKLLYKIQKVITKGKSF